MQKIVYNVETGGLNDEDPNGISGYMSFNRLAKLLAESGEVRSDEILTHIVVTKRGLDLRCRIERA
jgi:hypothetical protein